MVYRYVSKIKILTELRLDENKIYSDGFINLVKDLKDNMVASSFHLQYVRQGR